MKNMKIKFKLIFSFGIIIILAVAVGIVGIIGMSSLNQADIRMYENNVLGMDTLGSIRENYALQRMTYRNFMVYDADSDYFQSAIDKMRTLEANMDAYINTYLKNIQDQEEKESFEGFLNNYQNGFKNVKDQILELGQQGRLEDAKAFLADPDIIALSNTIDACMNDAYRFNVSYAESTVNENTAQAQKITLILIGVLILAVVLSVILTLYISGLIGKPLITMTKYMKKVAESGDTSLTPEDVALIEGCTGVKDETSECIIASAEFVQRVLEIGKYLGMIAEGDLSFEINMLSERDTMGTALKNMLANLNKMFEEISNASMQVSTGSKQISDGAQSLAQGTTQQAAAVEQLSTSIEEVSKKTDSNAEMAAKAAILAQTIKQNAETGSKQMDNMLIAVKEIKEASHNISKVIKAIDDIAFQTNILALNAAVEAARAGQHGKGFAVVAEEVRNLAAKSAEAAKNTGGLITDSMEKAELGAHIAADTAASLADIVTGINESSKLIEDMAISSEEQSTAISQINKGIEQVAMVIQHNSAASEESAAAAEEMSEQSDLLEELIARFKLKNSHNYPAPVKAPKYISIPNKDSSLADKY